MITSEQSPEDASASGSSAALVGFLLFAIAAGAVTLALANAAIL